MYLKNHDNTKLSCFQILLECFSFDCQVQRNKKNTNYSTVKSYLNLRLFLAVGTPQPKLQCRAVPHLHLLDVNSAEAAVPELLWALLWLQERGTGMAVRAQRCISQPVSSWWAVLIHFQAHLRGDDWVSILDLQNFKHHFTHIRDFVYRQNMDYGWLLSQQERKSFAVKIIYCTEDLFNNKNKNKSISQLNCKLSLKLVELIVVKYINNWSGEQSLESDINSFSYEFFYQK